MYGMAVQQGWADINDLIRERNNGEIRDCDAEADFRNVLTMTGESPDLSDPTFIYDGGGRRCLDALPDFIDANNPDGLGNQ